MRSCKKIKEKRKEMIIEEEMKDEIFINSSKALILVSMLILSVARVMPKSVAPVKIVSENGKYIEKINR